MWWLMSTVLISEAWDSQSEANLSYTGQLYVKQTYVDAEPLISEFRRQGRGRSGARGRWISVGLRAICSTQ